MKLVLFISFYIVEISRICHGELQTPTDHKIWEELESAKTVMTNIATQLEKFNSLYLTKLEQKMLTMVSTLSSIDSNIKNLQERAHVWDTFQLHVSAWNEQINTLDKKVEIISKGQEKMLVLDSKVNQLLSLEYRIERIQNKQDSTLTLLQTITRVLENQHHDPLFSEFTTRGVLSTLKTIERKLDKLQMQQSSGQSMLVKQLADNKRKSEPDLNQRGKLLIKCNTPPVVEEMLSDVASKVDVIFDKFTSIKDSDEYNNSEEQRDSAEVSQESKSDPDLKLIKGLLKRLNQPCKRTIKVLENLESSIEVINNTTVAILEDEQSVQTEITRLYQNNDRKLQTISTKTNDIVNLLNELALNIYARAESNQEKITNLFTEQREAFMNILNLKFKHFYSRSQNENTATGNDNEEDNTTETNTDIPNYIFNVFPLNTDRDSCDDIDITEVSGVYDLKDGGKKINNAGRNYNTRYCEVTNNGVWTVIQRRGENGDIQTFNKSWEEYKNGFGYLEKDFWFGNDYIHQLTNDKEMILRVELEDFEGHTAWAEYSTFLLSNELDKYKLTIGDYKGNASDSFSAHNNSYFSTYDRKNDDAPPCCPCSPSYGGGWWFYSCFEANLNGVYYTTPNKNEYFKGLIWEHWLGNYSLRKTKMMLKSKTTAQNEFGSVTEPYTEDPYEIPEDP